ncbi:MAG: NUDIX domain-containing protein [Gemmatimonadales bacterium]
MTPDPRRELRLASTVLLVRDRATPAAPGDSTIEVFMARRHVETVFVGGAYVFPGGRVDPEDAIDPARCVGVDPTSAGQRLSLGAGALAHYVAAIRECFEEAGVLLAYDREGRLLDFADPAVDERFRVSRERLNAGAVSMAEIVEREDLRLATDRIEYWAHWITPLGEPRRYDTRFFIARAPGGQTAAHDEGELVNSAWVTPREAIERARRREWLIIFPTLMNLRALGRHPNVDEAIRWAASQPVPLTANLPRIFEGRVVLPGHPSYERAQEDITGVDPAVFERSFEP